MKKYKFTTTIFLALFLTSSLYTIACSDTDKSSIQYIINSINSIKEYQISDGVALSCWENLTPLARNEWICWVEDAKKSETRHRRIGRVCADLKEGKRRPCCWGGCPHREKNELRLRERYTDPGYNYWEKTKRGLSFKKRISKTSEVETLVFY